jgi:hypothetical protein
MAETVARVAMAEIVARVANVQKAAKAAATPTICPLS